MLTDKRDDRGVYRRVPVRIMGAKHEPVQPYLIEPKMEQLMVDYANNTEHIVTKLARFHIEFEGIHPFIDGNGRTGRLLVNFEFMKEGFRQLTLNSPIASHIIMLLMNIITKQSFGNGKLFARYLNERLDSICEF